MTLYANGDQARPASKGDTQKVAETLGKADQFEDRYGPGARSLKLGRPFAKSDKKPPKFEEMFNHYSRLPPLPSQDHPSWYQRRGNLERDRGIVMQGKKKNELHGFILDTAGKLKMEVRYVHDMLRKRDHVSSDDDETGPAFQDEHVPRKKLAKRGNRGSRQASSGRAPARPGNIAPQGLQGQELDAWLANHPHHANYPILNPVTHGFDSIERARSLYGGVWRYAPSVHRGEPPIAEWQQKGGPVMAIDDDAVRGIQNTLNEASNVKTQEGAAASYLKYGHPFQIRSSHRKSWMKSGRELNVLRYLLPKKAACGSQFVGVSRREEALFCTT